ncbi:hypothetical protein C2G38_2158450 [Gigaspora rosea]|uniref:Uncharacterized protein n=1 Tax=Gigaspora rosea TaxID=44941 RepID=A0A397W4I4_9GLOM|nr:hypothetical protein C2G38_2158450 [Gigaspora rosea]
MFRFRFNTESKPEPELELSSVQFSLRFVKIAHPEIDKASLELLYKQAVILKPYLKIFLSNIRQKQA